MTVHICTDELLVIEASVSETPDDDSVKSLVNKTLQENDIHSWHSMEISQFSVNGKRLIMVKPAKVYIPRLMAKLIRENS